MTQMTISQALEAAWQHHQQGRLAEAESLYRQVLTAYPDQPDALQLLGVLASQVGKADLAIELIRRAIALNPNQALYHSNLGQVFSTHGQFDQAIGAFEQALTLNPNLPSARINLGNVYLAKGQLDPAIDCFRSAIALNPNLAEPHNNLGNALRQKGLIDQAIAEYHRAIELKPDLPDAHYNLATVLKDEQRYPEAIESFRTAIALRPNYPEAYNNLGNAYQSLGDLEQAEQLFRTALQQRPSFPNALSNLGNAVRDQGRLDEAITLYHRAITTAPGWALPHYNYALTLLLQGDLQRGWQEHEARRRAPEIGIFLQDFPKPSWTGADLNGRTILIHSEQGYGDVIQFARYVPMVAQRGGRVIFQCQSQLIRLFKSLPGVDQLVARDDTLPEFDVHCPLLSLPLLFKTNSVDQIPAAVPYLGAEPEAREEWRERLGDYEGKVKVGLVWSGRIHPPGRSVSLTAFSSLANLNDIALISLQYGSAAAEADHPPHGMKIASFTEDLRDFADTAALLDNLDLLITIDTAAAHLAGAMAKPAWVLLPWLPDWRWLMQRSDSPWYPTMRLYRQPVRGDFKTPVDRILKDLPAFIAQIKTSSI